MAQAGDIWNDGCSQSTAMSLATTISMPTLDAQSPNKVYQSLHAEPICETDRIVDVRTWIDSVGHVTCTYTITRDVDDGEGLMEVDDQPTVGWLKGEVVSPFPFFPGVPPSSHSSENDQSTFANELYASLMSQSHKPAQFPLQHHNLLDQYLIDNQDVCESMVLDELLNKRTGEVFHPHQPQYLGRHKDVGMHPHAGRREVHRNTNRCSSPDTRSYEGDIDEDLLPSPGYFRAHAKRMRREYGTKMLPRLVDWWDEKGRALAEATRSESAGQRTPRSDKGGKGRSNGSGGKHRGGDRRSPNGMPY